MKLFNVLKKAFTHIPTTTVQYRKYLGKTVSSAGLLTTSYSNWNASKAVVEPGVVSSFGGANREQQLYNDNGLNFGHKFVTVWICNADLNTVSNQDTPDQIQYDNKTYNIREVANWLNFDGWKRLYCEEVIV